MITVCAAALLALAGCARSVNVDAGEFAPDPICGQVILALPNQLAGLEQVPATAQSAVAWGSGEIVVRCGVSPPPPSEDRCISVTSSAGVTVDWINPEAGSALIPPHARAESGSWTFITYGRVPAVELVVRAESGVEDQPDVLNAISLAVSHAPAERFCVGATEY